MSGDVTDINRFESEGDKCGGCVISMTGRLKLRGEENVVPFEDLGSAMNERKLNL